MQDFLILVAAILLPVLLVWRIAAAVLNRKAKAGDGRRTTGSVGSDGGESDFESPSDSGSDSGGDSGGGGDGGGGGD